MSSRESILRKLRAAPRPFPAAPPAAADRHMVPLDDTSPAALRARFIAEAEKLSCAVWPVTDAAAGLQKVLDLIGDDRAVLSWDFAHIPLPGLGEALAAAGIHLAEPRDGSVRVGLTGAEAALAATGTLVLASGPGKLRQASLLPLLHVAILTADQIAPDLESWAAAQEAQGLDHLRQAGHVALISGPSRTADIGMELVMGAHGPRELHIILLPDA